MIFIGEIPNYTRLLAHTEYVEYKWVGMSYLCSTTSPFQTRYTNKTKAESSLRQKGIFFVRSYFWILFLKIENASNFFLEVEFVSDLVIEYTI